jgi:RNA polymerase sigma factor (sigma-70 family)
VGGIPQLGDEEREGARQLIDEKLAFVRRAVRRRLAGSPARGWVDEEELLQVGYEALVQAVVDLMLGETEAFDGSGYIRGQVHEVLRRHLAQAVEDRERLVSLEEKWDQLCEIEAGGLNSPQGLLYVGCRQAVEYVVGSLERKRRAVVVLRFGLVDGQERTHAEVGDALGFSAARAEQLLSSALKKLRHPLRSRWLRDFLWVDFGG